MLPPPLPRRKPAPRPDQTALAAEVAHYRTQAGQEAASAQVLRLRCGEFEALRAADAEEIRRQGLKIRRLEAAAKTVTATEAEIRTPLRDTVVVRSGDPHPVRDSVRLFRWRDPWVTCLLYTSPSPRD